MTRRLLAALTLFAPTLLLPACTDRALDPEYPTALVTFDDALAGTWLALDEEGNERADDRVITVTIAPDKVAVKDDRLSPDTELDKAAATTDAYTISIATADPELPHPLNLNAYRLSINGRTYLGAQLSFKQFEESKLLTFVAPIHYIARIERDGDTLRIWNNEPALTWIPGAVPLDPLPNNDNDNDANHPAPPLPAPESKDEAFAVLTTDIDRLIALLSRPDADQLFAGKPWVLKRKAP